MLTVAVIFFGSLVSWSLKSATVIGCEFVPEKQELLCEENVVDPNIIPQDTKAILFTSKELKCDCELRRLLEWKETHSKRITLKGVCSSPAFFSGKSIEDLTSQQIPCGAESNQDVLLRRRRAVQENDNETVPAGNKTTTPGAPIWTCHFEKGLCQWFQLTDSDFEWTRHHGPTSTDDTGPISDHTTGTGFYIYVEASYPRVHGHKARLVSPTLRPVEPNTTCKMDLFIHMYGSNMGELIIYQAPVVGFAVKKLSLSGSQGDNWFHQQVQFDSDTDFQVIIEGVVGSNHKSDIAIDDVSFTSGCKRLVPSYVRLTGGLTFNAGRVEVYNQNVWGPVCREGWSEEDSSVACAELGFQNATTMGGSPENGTFLALSAVNCSSNETSISQCQLGTWSNSTTCSSGYVATLQCIGILPVCPQRTHLLCPADRQGNRKCISRADLCDFRSDCWDGSDETNCDNYTRCDFQDPDLCQWLLPKNDHMKWTRQMNVTGTGPSTGHNNDTNRYYLNLVETRGQQGSGKGKILVNPRFRGDHNGLCKVRFYYYMTGNTVVSLRLYAADRFDQRTMWSKLESQGSSWRRAEVQLANFSSSFLVIFEGEQSGNTVALDDVSFTPECRPALPDNVTCTEDTFQCGTGDCIVLDRLCDFQDDCLDGSDETDCGLLSSGRCNFETDFCHWTNVTSDDFDWQRHSGETPSARTGPSYDHTTGRGHYIYTEASSPRNYRDTARLISPQFMWKDVANCTLRFYYHMRGQFFPPGTLRVLLQNTITGDVTSPLWQRSGNHGNEWHRASVPIATSWPVTQVVIEAELGLWHTSDIAVDDISFSTQCYPSEAVHIFRNYDIRLVGGKNGSHQGRVEVFRVGAWGTICDDDWDLNDATVVCKQLGYGGAQVVYSGSYFGEGKGNIWLDNLACYGNETNLSECLHNGWGRHNCTHMNDAGVTCQKDGGTTNPVRLVGNYTRQGRVEIYHQGVWNAICYDGWDTHDAFVVCRQLGFPGAERIMNDMSITPQSFLANVRCQGNENTLGHCTHSGWNDGNCSYGYAAVVCSTDGTAEGNIRLVGGSSPSEGRVEVFHAGEWGTICGLDWTENNALVVCRELGFTTAQKHLQSFGPGSGRVWLDFVQCNGSENALVDCDHSGWEVTSCNHDHDAGVICSDDAYVGCYRDRQDHVMTEEFFSAVMTPVKCLRRCQTKGYQFAGLEWADKCYCGNHYDRYGNVSESECNLPCIGDPGKICGGTWALSVYSTNPAIIPTSVPGYAAVTQSCRTEINIFLALIHNTKYYSGDHRSGWISSPAHPNNYYSRTVCVWVLRLLPGTQAKIHFDFFFTEKNYDYLEVRDGSRDFSTLLTPPGGFDGSNSRDLTATSNVMWIRFYADETITEKGFNLTYTALGAPTRSPTTPTPLDATIPPSQLPDIQKVEGGCNGELDFLNTTFGYFDWYHSTGYVQSPDYPLNYANNLLCRWAIQVAPNYRVQVTVEHAEIAHGAQSGGLGDRLQVDDGIKTMNSHEHQVPWTFLSSGPLVRVLFVTDKSGIGQGFYLTFVRVNITDVPTSTPQLSTSEQPTPSSQLSSLGAGDVSTPSVTLSPSMTVRTDAHTRRTTMMTSSTTAAVQTIALYPITPTKVSSFATSKPSTTVSTGKFNREPRKKDEGLSGGAVAAIVVPILLLVVIAIILICLIKKKKKRGGQGVRHAFVNDSYDNLESMNMSARTNTTETQSGTANHVQPPSQVPANQEAAVYFAAPPPYTQTASNGIYFLPFGPPAVGGVTPVGVNPGYSNLYSAPPAYEATARPSANATTTTGIGSVTSLREAANDGSTNSPAFVGGLQPLRGNALPPIRGTHGSTNPEKHQPAQSEEAGPLPDKAPLTVVTSPEPSAPPRPLSATSQVTSVLPASNEFDMEVPFEFLCPITNKIMEMPMTASDGYNYERRAIRKWFRRKQTSPMTNEQLSDLTLRPNEELRQRIEKFVSEHSSV